MGAIYCTIAELGRLVCYTLLSLTFFIYLLQIKVKFSSKEKTIKTVISQQLFASQKVKESSGDK